LLRFWILYLLYARAFFVNKCKQLILIKKKKNENIGTSIFAIGQGRCAMLTVPSSFRKIEYLPLPSTDRKESRTQNTEVPTYWLFRTCIWASMSAGSIHSANDQLFIQPHERASTNFIKYILYQFYLECAFCTAVVL
jgi:hypothetical protein